jgi:hypothetical protein
MEDLTVPLNQKVSQWFVRIQIVLAIMFILQGLAYSGKSFWWFPYFSISYGVILLAVMLAYPRFHREYFVKIDEQGIRGRTGFTKQIDLSWEHLAHADIMMFALILKTKAGETIHIDLGDLTYDQHRLVKPRLVEIFRSKGLLHDPV